MVKKLIIPTTHEHETLEDASRCLCNASDCVFVECPNCMFYKGNIEQFKQWLKENES